MVIENKAGTTIGLGPAVECSTRENNVAIWGEIAVIDQLFGHTVGVRIQSTLLWQCFVKRGNVCP